MNYTVNLIFPHDEKSISQYRLLCEKAEIAFIDNLDLLFGLFDHQRKLLAGGGILGNTLRGLVSDESLRGQGLMAQLVTSLLSYQAKRGVFRNYLYGKKNYEALYKELGFYTLAEAQNRMVFMENSPRAFSDFLDNLQAETKTNLSAGQFLRAKEQGSAAIVMNGNPFTKGHLSLVEKAHSEQGVCHVFLLEEDVSLFSFQERWEMLKKATAKFPGVLCHKSSSYIISRQSFPSYFLRNLDEAAVLQAEIDAQIFVRIAQSLNIHHRYLGSEPHSDLTREYNKILGKVLSEAGIKVHVMERSSSAGGRIYSGSLVRALLKEGKLSEAMQLVPDSSRDYLREKEL